MTNTRLELCNMIRMEAGYVSDTGFPLDVFPQAVQSVILDMWKSHATLPPLAKQDCPLWLQYD